MKILILSNSEWDDGNSFGSSFSNIFGNINGLEIANIYCRSGKPNTKSCNRFFQITEKLLLKNLLNRGYPAGQIVNQNKKEDIATPADTFNIKEQYWVNFIKKNRWIALFWLRDIVWFFGRWKSKDLKKFIDDFNPDIIFLPVYYSVYLNKIGLFLKKYSTKPMVGYISDDCYTLRQFSLNPLYWIDRFIKRKWVKRAVDACEILYVISEIQKKDYDKSFNKDCRILFKGGNFNDTTPVKIEVNNPIKLVYTGNIGTGRYKILGDIGKVLDNINQNSILANLHIYSQTPLNSSMKNAIFSKNSILFHGGVPSSEISRIQKNADILVHVESFQIKERLLVRQSFSTKIVDYFHAARCIFAVGWSKAASIDYLVKNDAALVAINKQTISDQLNRIVNRSELLEEYAQKAWECGKRNHQIKVIQQKLYNDLSELVNTGT